MSGDEISVLHVIHCLTVGGASRAMAALAEEQAREPGANIAILSLTPANRAAAAELPRHIELIDGHGWAGVRESIARAAIVHVHAWNAPQTYQLLRMALPASRLLLWYHVAGRAVPQLIPRAFAARASEVAVACSAAVSGSGFAGARLPEVVLPTRDLSRFARVRPRAHDGVVAGHVGSLDGVRIPPGLLTAYADPRLEGVRFAFAGTGEAEASLRGEAKVSGIDQRVSWLGHVPDIEQALAGFDLFCAPIGPGAYSSSDLSIMEAMAAGVPPVVLSPEGTSDLVTDGVDGLVTGNMEAYIGAVARLAADAPLRRRLGAAARERALHSFHPSCTAAAFARIYERMLREPKCELPAMPPLDAPRGIPLSPGAEAFIFSLDGTCPAFVESVAASSRAEADAADERIALLPAPYWTIATGGLGHYRSRYPRDPWLAYWWALRQAATGRRAKALAELRRAQLHGLAAARSEPFEAALLASLRGAPMPGGPAWLSGRQGTGRETVLSGG